MAVLGIANTWILSKQTVRHPGNKTPAASCYEKSQPPKQPGSSPIIVLLKVDMEKCDLFVSSFSDERRVHFIDNLQSTLVVLFIIQHAITETAYASHSHIHSRALELFVLLCKTVLPGLFFFVAGYTSALWRSSTEFFGYKRSNTAFFWRRTTRLLLPAVVYSVLGHILVWMLLTKRWPRFFADVKPDPLAEEAHVSPLSWTFGRLEGPVLFLFSLYVLDMAYVSFYPTKKALQLPCTPPRKTGALLHQRTTKTTTRREWYLALASSLVVMSFWTFMSAAIGWTDKPLSTFPLSIAAYDPISPAAPLQYIVAYVIGTLSFHHPQTVFITTSLRAFIALLASIYLSLTSLSISHDFSPVLQGLIKLDTLSPTHPSFVGGGVNWHTLFYSLWATCSFMGIALPLVSLFSLSSWTRRDWGVVAKHSYLPVWVHMIPIIVFTRLLAVDGTVDTWNCLLVSTGAILSSWMVSLTVTGFFGPVRRAFYSPRSGFSRF